MLPTENKSWLVLPPEHCQGHCLGRCQLAGARTRPGSLLTIKQQGQSQGRPWARLWSGSLQYAGGKAWTQLPTVLTCLPCFPLHLDCSSSFQSPGEQLTSLNTCHSLPFPQHQKNAGLKWCLKKPFSNWQDLLDCRQLAVPHPLSNILFLVHGFT